MVYAIGNRGVAGDADANGDKISYQYSRVYH